MALKLLHTDSMDGFVERTVRNFLDLFVLDLLKDRSRHGYELMQELVLKTGTHVSPGTLYPLLYELEDQGMVSGRWADPIHRDRRVYTITGKGEDFRQESIRDLGQLIASSKGGDLF